MITNGYLKILKAAQISCLLTHLAYCLNRFLNVKALEVAFKNEEVLVRASSKYCDFPVESVPHLVYRAGCGGCIGRGPPARTSPHVRTRAARKPPRPRPRPRSPSSSVLFVCIIVYDIICATIKGYVVRLSDTIIVSVLSPTILYSLILHAIQ